MTRRPTRREIRDAINGLEKNHVDDADPPTKADLGVTADFVHFEGDDLPEIPDGWTWEHEEDEHGTSFIVAVREGGK